MTTLIGENLGSAKRARGSTPVALSPSRALAAAFALQRDRWILWLPVAMIAGAAAWLTAPMDPPAWLGPAVFVAGFAAALGLMAWPTARVDGPARRLAIVLAALSALAAAAGLGLAAGELRGVTVAQNPYVGGEEAVRVEGWVVANDASDNGPRLRLLVRGIDGVAEPPRNVRVSGV